MPDIEHVKGTLAGTGGVILDGMVAIAVAGKWTHHRYEEPGKAPYWVTTVQDVLGTKMNIPRGTYRLKLQFGAHIADMRAAKYDGERFTGEGAADIKWDAVKETVPA